MQSGTVTFVKEIRLGLVLYGGVSLAVYENGVAQEFFRAVKGEGVYGLIKNWLQTDIVVDIVSGTSAGGINGILLSHALANNLEFRGCAKLWRENGDLLALIRSPDSATTTSVLESEGYYQPMIVKAFREMPEYRAPDFARPSATAELDLFVTGTDVDGQIFSMVDDNGHIIDIKNHRRVFQLSYRFGRKNEFATDSDSLEALGKLCRVTSCFPVAFAPVDVNIDAAAKSVDRNLDRWGQLKGEAKFFLDGGVLDNKPFSYTINAIFSRTANRKIERRLFYVEPDPEHFDKLPPHQPTVIEAAVKALIGIPGYESIGDDLAVIAAHNKKLEFLEQIQAHLILPAPAANANILDSHASRPTETLQSIYRHTRLKRLLDRILEGVFKEDKKLILIPTAERGAAARISKCFKEWELQLGDEILERYDIYYRQRLLNHLVYSLYDHLYGSRESRPPTEEATSRYPGLWEKLNHLTKVLEIVRFAMESLVDAVDLQWQKKEPEQVWVDLQTRFDALLDLRTPFDLPFNHGRIAESNDLTLKALRQEFAEKLKAWAEQCAHRDISPQTNAGNLLLLFDMELEALLHSVTGVSDPLYIEWQCFQLIDCYLFPMQQLAGIESKDRIRVVRVSPVDAQRKFSRRTLRDKLCGEALGHFSGFLSRPWRSNDILWGRLDAACQLIECIVGQEIRPAMKPSLADLSAAFPNSDASVLQQALNHAASNDELIDLLVEAAQREIIIEDVPHVMEDSIAQQRAWNEYKVADGVTAATLPFDVKSWAWKIGIKEIDRTVLDFAAAQFAQKLSPQSWVEFFQKHYGVGTQDVYDAVPTPVLVEMASKAGAVLENCVIAAGGKDFESTAKSNKLFRFGFHFPLRALYRFSHWLRVAPSFSQITIAAMFVLALTLIGVGVYFWSVLIRPESGFLLARFATLILAPILMILFVCWLIAERQRD